MTMAPKLIKKKQGHNKSQDDRKQEPVLASGEYRDLATMSAFRLEKGKGKGATLISKGCAKSTRDIIEWKRENSREAMMVEREVTCKPSPILPMSGKPVESPLQGTWDAHQWTQGGRSAGRTMLDDPLNHQWRCRCQGWLTWKTETVCRWMSCASPIIPSNSKEIHVRPYRAGDTFLRGKILCLFHRCWLQLSKGCTALFEILTKLYTTIH